jgi:hypothetical protein
MEPHWWSLQVIKDNEYLASNEKKISYLGKGAGDSSRTVKRYANSRSSSIRTAGTPAEISNKYLGNLS